MEFISTTLYLVWQQIAHGYLQILYFLLLWADILLIGSVKGLQTTFNLFLFISFAIALYFLYRGKRLIAFLLPSGFSVLYFAGLCISPFAALGGGCHLQDIGMYALWYIAPVFIISVFLHFLFKKGIVDKFSELVYIISIASVILLVFSFVSSLPTTEAALTNLALKTSNEDFCKFIIDDSKEDVCFLKAAVRFGNEDICYKIEGQKMMVDRDLAPSCFIDIAGAKNEPSICELSSDDYDKDRCLIKFAVSQKNEKICERLEDVTDGIFIPSFTLSVSTGTKNICYYNVAQETKNPAICDLMTKARYDYHYEIAVAVCYIQIAEATGDRSLCEKAQSVASEVVIYPDVKVCTEFLPKPRDR